MNIKLRAVWALAATLLLCGVLQAQETYPSRPIRLVIPFGPGGGTDIVARLIAQKLSERVGVPVIAENKPGANGNLAAVEVVKAPADGYTLLYNTSSLTISRALYRDLSYAKTDLAPVVRTAEVPLVLVISPSVPANTLKEFIEYLKRNPDKAFYGSAGNGNISHLAIAELLQITGAKAVHVPFKTGGAALIATVAGEVQFYFDTTNSSAQMIKSGRLKALAVSTLTRSALLPEVPTLSEALIPDFNIPVWQGIVAPAKTPPAIIARLNAELNAILQDRQFRANLAAQDTSAIGSTAQGYGAFLNAEYERWAGVVKANNIKID